MYARAPAQAAGTRHVLYRYPQVLPMPWLQVRETPEVYRSAVLPYIRSIPPDRLQWVYNILEKKVGGSSGAACLLGTALSGTANFLKAQTWVRFWGYQ